MSQLQEVILKALPTDSRQAVLPKEVPVGDHHPKSVNLCLERLRSAGMVAREARTYPKRGRLWVYWRI